MASTYSNLKIQLMATGENSGTWGNVTNDNLGVALEEAIVGSADVTFASGTVTLTLTNTNASQTARNLRLNLTGTSGGAQDLIVPAIEKVYIVNNGCADAITVKNNSGTGIAVPAGKTMWVYNNGTNVVDAVTHLTSLTLATALPVASGGTGSTTATFSGENITSLNASSISSGTIANARTTATNANGASTIVARDASGNFVAHDIQFDSFGVGTAASGVSGEIRATNNVTAFYTSDRKFKTNIQSIPNALAKVSEIGGKTFDWTDDYINDHGGEDGYFLKKNDFGVIAQDVQAVFPIAVRAKPDGTLAVDYEKLCALAFQAIKELSDKVKALEGK
jgi:hypothetical protein